MCKKMQRAINTQEFLEENQSLKVLAHNMVLPKGQTSQAWGQKESPEAKIHIHRHIRNESEKLKNNGRKNGLLIKNVWAAGEPCKKISKYHIIQQNKTKTKTPN